LPVLSGDLKREAELKKTYAEEQRLLPTADALYEEADAQTTASGRFNAFVSGVIFYPEDSRFQEGVNTSARGLMDYAIRMHGQGNYSVASSRYQAILDASGVDALLLKEAELRKGYADKGQKIPTANQLYNQAVANSTATGRFNLFVEGYIFYPNDQRFINGVNTSGLDLFNFATRLHERKDFSGAIQRYQLLISSPGVPSYLVESAKRNLADAEDGVIPEKEVITYTDVSSTFNQAVQRQLGLNPPPQTDLYRNAPAYIHSSFISDIYERGVTTGSTTNIRRSATLNGTVYKSVSAGTTFEILGTVTGDTWNGSNQWYRIRYENTTLYVHSSLATRAQVGKLSSRTNSFENTNNSSHIFTSISQGTEVVLQAQVTGTSWNGSTRWYRINAGTWRNAKQSEFRAYMDPMNNDIYQHLVLSSSAGVSSNQLNNILAGKGILDGKGQAFIQGGLAHSVNEVYLISHALLETGNGTSLLATGIEVGRNSSGNLEIVTPSNRSSLSNIKTTYNMFGIGAVDSDPNRQGAFRAYREGWFTPEASIVGGAKFIGEDYIHNANKQNTLYKMRWNPANPGTKQYATDMGWAVKQVSRIKSIYEQLDNPVLHFDIPRYR
jgi:mannosyl-glycoprotein endo-beta-N-acetylglucosaminidase